ncbi:MAG: HAMP domain-containing sensor histidine kinase [Anaerolineae bacterium]|nr:HAMP domain-containing sensor histidine kinase [Anaerolineae bacterium]
MLKTLRSRLLLSYVTILLILLVLVGFILLAFLRTRPLPTDEITNDLTAVLLDVRALETIRLEFRMSQGQGMGMRARLNAYGQLLTDYLGELSAERGVRALLVSENGEVRYDSGGVLTSGDSVRETERTPLVPPSRIRLNALSKGRFIDADGSQWLFVAQPLFPMSEMRTDPSYLLIAAPVPRATLREVFRLFGDTFFVPLAKAGLVALVIAVGLSLLIAGSVAGHLQRMSAAAQRIASGDYRQRVEVAGPREVRVLAHSFNDMAERVATAQQAQRDFLANVSHDLRTPLTSIQGFSQAIAEGVTSDPAAAQRAAQIIHDETARLHRMVESLLDLARLDSSQMNMRRDPVTPGDLLRAIGAGFSDRARARQISLRLIVPSNLPPVSGDGDRLAQVFTNLLDNALKHTPSGGTVTLSAALADGGIVVSVRDTGEGIPPDEISRIFERFYQVDKSRQRDRLEDGWGLGLAIARQIVEAHGGTIRADSRAGQGTTFTVWLPLGRE